MIDLSFQNVTKMYRIPEESAAGEAAGGALARGLRALRRPRQDFLAVNDVSFEVARGEAVGVIGHNGAGKSTVLKMLSNITTPTSGEIIIRGRLSALIEVGSGFHPELTGRENVFLCGAILGMRRREIAAKLDSIAEFAGLRPFLDVPVKRYSSGMYVRLGFSIAAHLEPDILLLDEVLAVGDASFQQKCLARIEELKRAGTTIVFISHDLMAVERLCDRVLLMNRGRLARDGSPHEVITEYRQMATEFVASTPRDSGMTKEAEVTGLSFRDESGREATTFRTGRPLAARVPYEAREPVEDAVFELFFYSPDGQMHCMFTTEYGGTPFDLAPGAGAVEFETPGLGLLPDVYTVDVVIKRRGAPAGSGVDWQARCATIRVDPDRVVRGNFYMAHEWRVTEGNSGHDLTA
jgi:lipopolysaccharide transport system ATP-binding protein